MEQTLDDVEFIFVDDCSPDESIDILKHVLTDYPQRKVQIIRHEENRGLPAARNTGLSVATGIYIFHCDSDDYLERDALEKMYKKAVATNADIVYSDWYLTFGPSKEAHPQPLPGEGRCSSQARYMRCPEYATAEEALRGLLHGTMKYNVWNKLVKRELYYYEDENDNGGQSMNVDSPLQSLRFRHCFRHSIRFPEGHGMGEDMTMILLFAKAQRVAYLPIATYHYVRQNPNAFTATGAVGGYEDLKFNADRIISALQGIVSDSDLACFKLNVKYPFLISSRCADYDRWTQWFPEANTYILSHQTSTRTRLLEKCATWHFHLPLRLHFYLLQYLQ